MEKNKILEIINDQQELFSKKDNLINREINLQNFFKGNEIIIISGIRRCGKSSLLKIISKQLNNLFVYINFDDIRFTDFQLNDFQLIEEIVSEKFSNKAIYLLDEIQNIPKWEKWVNNLYSKNIKVFVTGSNSSLLSSEISTFLTGRNKTIQLYPFSFREFLNLKQINLNFKSNQEKIKIIKYFKEYLEKGGFPLIIKNNDLELSIQYFEDIINKDIIKRYKIKKIKEINELILYLFSNVAKQYSYSTLKQISGIKSLSMIKNYIEYLKQTFLADTIQRFDFSLKKQKVSSSKFYVLDNSFLKTIAFNFSQNLGKRLENMVFTELKRRYKEIYYHYNKKECDFIIKEKLKIKNAIQVCLSLENPLTKKREIQGLLEALKDYNLKKGLILTMDTEQSLVIQNKQIIIKPVWKWLLNI